MLIVSYRDYEKEKLEFLKKHSRKGNLVVIKKRV